VDAGSLLTLCVCVRVRVCVCVCVYACVQHVARTQPWCPPEGATLRLPRLLPAAQADRQGRSGDFAAAFAKSELKAEADREIEKLLAQSSDLGGWRRRGCL
jgi:hypothetical protein